MPAWSDAWVVPFVFVVILAILIWGAFFNRRRVLRYAGYSPEWWLCRLLTSTARQAKVWQVVLLAPVCFLVWGLWANYLADQRTRKGVVKYALS